MTDALAESGEVAQGYITKLGIMYVSLIESFLESDEGRKARGSVQLIFTSPPFPLNRKKKYGNKAGEEYLEWLRDLAPRLAELLTPDGSIVMELGNAWEPGAPVMSTLALEAFLAFKEAGKLCLCQQFVCHNPARLPSPAQWVNVERIRVKDSFTHIWWMSPTERPKADNRNVLTEYSPEMKELLTRRSYNSGRRPSGHLIGRESFFKDNGGAIPPNVFVYSNTTSIDRYREYCRERELKPHPAPMQMDVVRFFVKMLTDPGDLVLDPFGGSNSTGAAAEDLGRRCLAIEPDREYVEGSKGRFPQFAGTGPASNATDTLFTDALFHRALVQFQEVKSGNSDFLGTAYTRVDECHRIGSRENSRILNGLHVATLGLSATPRREYADAFEAVIEPALGPVIYQLGIVRSR